MRKIYVLKSAVLFILITILSFQVFSQKAPMKYGKINIEDLKMTEYAYDTTAEAVILCDYGVFSPEHFEFTRTCRIKILKKDGSRWANKQINSYAKMKLKAAAYNLVDGEIEVTKMKSESVYEVFVEGNRVATKFSIPNVKEGTIIEFQYTYDGMPYEWRFQDVIPVKWSELRMYQNDYLKFQKNFFGFESLSINENGRWVGENMPAFRIEPFMNSYTNYLTKFEFAIRQIFVPGRILEEYGTSWEQVNKTLYDDRYVGKRLETNLYLNNTAKEIEETELPELDKAILAYDLVKSTLTWNEGERIFAYTPLNTVFNSKKNGSCAEINYILIALLDKLDIDVTPVLLSTRDNGLLSPIFPSINKMNYVVALLKINDKNYMLDATDKLAPFGLLPKRCINGEGITLVKENSQWVNLGTNLNSKEVFYSQLSLQNDGEIKGTVSQKLLNYAAFDFRKTYEEYTSQDEFIQNMESENNGLIINDYDIENIEDIYKPIVTKYDITLQNNANVIGEFMYLNPMIFEKMDNNPFKIEERKYPIDYIHPIEKTFILNLSIPDGYAIDQLPESFKASLPENKVSFLYSIKSSGQNIQLTYKFNVNTPNIYSSEYQMLKQFYDLIIKKHSEMIVLKKINS